ncbi:MAG: hypothetical protein UX26_C0026G0003 [Parcubacteria group bacterium GW2011_GWC1_45_9]
MNAIWFFGFAPAQVDAIMPELVKTLDLGHEIYSVNEAGPVALFDESGKRQGQGKMISVPCFQTVRENPNLLVKLWQKFGVPVTCVMTEPKLAVGGKLY